MEVAGGGGGGATFWSGGDRGSVGEGSGLGLRCSVLQSLLSRL